MPLDPEYLRELQRPPVDCVVSDRDAMLYALSIGLGSDPTNEAELYRLNQDRNPLHADPELARAAGFPRPILHGLASLGLVAVAAFRQWPNRVLTRIETRFSNPVYPGEALAVDFWEEGEEVAFQMRVPRRSTTVLSSGRLA